jgi:hypothetical protein
MPPRTVTWITLLFLYTLGSIPWREDMSVARLLHSVSIRIETHDPIISGGEDSSCLRPRSNCDRHTQINNNTIQQSVSKRLIPFSLEYFSYPWRRRQHIPPKHRFLQDPRGFKSQKPALFIVTTVTTSNTTFESSSYNNSTTYKVTSSLQVFKANFSWISNASLERCMPAYLILLSLIRLTTLRGKHKLWSSWLRNSRQLPRASPFLHPNILFTMFP